MPAKSPSPTKSSLGNTNKRKRGKAAGPTASSASAQSASSPSLLNFFKQQHHHHHHGGSGGGGQRRPKLTPPRSNDATASGYDNHAGDDSNNIGSAQINDSKHSAHINDSDHSKTQIIKGKGKGKAVDTDLERAIQESLKEHQRWIQAHGQPFSSSSSSSPSSSIAEQVVPEEMAETQVGASTASSSSVIKQEEDDSDPPPTLCIQSDGTIKEEAELQSATFSKESSPTKATSGRNAFSLLMMNSNAANAPTIPGGSSSLSTIPNAASSTDQDPLLTPSSLIKLWTHSDVAEAKNRAVKGTRKPRSVPFYKILHGMPLCVDGFRFGAIPGCVGYFLSHAHSDHYAGLSPSWSAGPVYCTQTTANLIESSLRVPSGFLHPLPLDEEFEIPQSGGVHVTLLPANHCPGSCVFLFRGPLTAFILPTPAASLGVPAPPTLPFIDARTGKEKEWLYLHCGDFRASPYLLEHPRIKGKHLDIIYLDTTYLNPRYCFPAQEEVVRECGEFVYRLLATDEEREGADRQRKEWEREGIKEEDDLYAEKYVQSAREQKVEERKRRFDGERKGMSGWLGIKSEGSEEDGSKSLASASASSPPRKPALGTLAKGLFRYDDDEAHGFIPRPKAEADNDEEAAWLDAHVDDEAPPDLSEPPRPGLERDDSQQQMSDIAAVSPVKAEEMEDDLGLGEMDEEELFGLDEDDGLDDLQSTTAAPAEGEVESESESKPGSADLWTPENKYTDPTSSALTQSLLPFGARRRVGAKESIGGGDSRAAALGADDGSESKSNRLLVVVGTYSIGKEKVALSCALRLGTRIYCPDPRKYRIFQQLVDEPLLRALLTRDPSKAQVHVTGLWGVNYESLTGHLRILREKEGVDFGRVVAFRPTGWSYRPSTTNPNDLTSLSTSSTTPSTEADFFPRLLSRNLSNTPSNGRGYSHLTSGSFLPTRDSTPQIQIFGIPYSEHSSFLELSAFCLGLHSWGRIIPTVNVGNPTSRRKMEVWIAKWREERERRRKKGLGPWKVHELARQREYF